MKITEMTIKQLNELYFKKCVHSECPKDCPLRVAGVCFADLFGCVDTEKEKDDFKRDIGLDYNENLTIGKALEATCEKKAKMEIEL